MKIYLASQIFAECWRDFNEKIAQRLEQEFPNWEFYVPQRNNSINDKTRCAGAEEITAGDLDNNLDHDDVVIAILDGDTPGIGTTFECGYFARLCQEEINRQGYTHKRIFGLYTDTREAKNTYLPAKNQKMQDEFCECQYSYLNLLLVGGVKRYGKMCRTIDEIIEELHKLEELINE